MVTTEDFDMAMQVSDDVANLDGILIKVASVYEAPTAHDYFQRVKPYVTEKDHLVGLMVAPHSMDAFLTYLGRHDSAQLIYRSDETKWDEDPGPVFEYGWNHTTLQALKSAPHDWFYLQVAYPRPFAPALVDRQIARYGDEVLFHHEMAQMDGDVQIFALPLVRWTSK